MRVWWGGLAIAAAVGSGFVGPATAQGHLGAAGVVPRGSQHDGAPAPAAGADNSAKSGTADGGCDAPPVGTTPTLVRPIGCNYTTPRGSFGPTAPGPTVVPPAVATNEPAKPPVAPASTSLPRQMNGGFAYYPPGALVAQDKGRGRTGDRKIYLPGIIFPLQLTDGMELKPAGHHAHMNSQIWGYGGGGWNGHGAAGGSECDVRNYNPMQQRDTYCEVRGWDMPMCPGGTGHQGQDIRPPGCDDNKWNVVAVVDGVITLVTSNTTVRLKGGDGTEYYYLHMHPDSITVEEGSIVKQGQVLGRVSNFMNGARDTTHHLHFQVKQTLTIGGKVQRVYVPPFASLIVAYRRAKGLDPGVDDKGNLIADPAYEIGAQPADDAQKPPFSLWPIPNVVADTGHPIKPIDLTRAFQLRDTSAANKTSVNFAAAGLPDGLSLDPATGLITGKLSPATARGGTNGVYTVSATATDGRGATASQSFTVTATNKTPVVVAHTAAKTFREGDTVLIAAGSAFADPDLDTLSFSATGLPDYLQIDPATGRISGVLALGTATAAPNGVYPVTVTANDGEGNTISEIFALTALPQKQPDQPAVASQPLVVAPLPHVTAMAGEDLVVINTAAGFKPAAGDAAPLSYAATGLPAGATIDPATGQIAGILSASAADDNGGVYPVIVTASNAAGGTVSQTLLLSISNRPPVVTSKSVNMTYVEGGKVLISAGSAFTAAKNAVLTFTATGLPGGLSIDPKQGTIEGTMPVGAAAGGVNGVYTISVTAKDERGATAVESFALAVSATPQPPVISGTIAAITASDGADLPPLDVSQSVKPANGVGPLLYTAGGLPDGVKIDPATGVIAGTLAANASSAMAGGTYQVKVAVKDTSNGLSTTTGFVITAQATAGTPPTQPPAGSPAPQGWWPWVKDKVTGLWGWWGKK